MLNILKKFFTKNNKLIKIILFFIFPLLIVLSVELIQKQSFFWLWDFIIWSSRAFLFSYFIVFIVFYMLYLLISRHSFYINFLFFIILSIINLFKRQILWEPLYLTDIMAQYSQSSNLVSFVHFKINFWIIIFWIIIFLINLFYFKLFRDFKIKNITLRIPLFIVFFLLFYFVILTNTFRDKYLLKTIWYNLDSVNWRQNYNYDENWFLRAFYINIKNAYIKKPDWYNNESIEKIVKNIKTETWTTDDKPDFIFILSEAFFDLSRIKSLEFSEDLTPNLHSLQKETYFWKMISPVFWWKTALAEFELLTWNLVKNIPVWSIPYTQYVTKNIPAIPWILKENWYSTQAIHTYEKTFFNRNNAYPHLWFDEFIAQEDMKWAEYKWPFISDDVFTKKIIENLEKPGKNKFIFGISMQNHFSYENKYKKNEIDVELKNTNLSDKSKDIITNYAQWIKDADKNLWILLDYLKTRKKHTVVLFFGDHLPNLWTDNMWYTETNYINWAHEKDWDTKDLKNMYSPDFIIWSNKKNEFENKNLWYIWASYLWNYLLDSEKIKNKWTYFDYISQEFNCMQANSPVLSNTKETWIIRNKERKNCLDYDKNHSLLQYDILFWKRYIQ